ncbi:MAG: GNAT family N-acetyltransferase [bacterium]|nr:GNAT family N-acetyltransferase [bacterium]
MNIRKIKENERNEAVTLVLNVFMEFEAPVYSLEGIENFKDYVHKSTIFDELQIYAAFHSQKIIGVIATRKQGSHISLFFVDPKYQRQGIGRKLFNQVKKDCTGDVLTVNASPYAVQIYKRLGFIATDTEQTTDGIRFTPMIYRK